jgi:hypothetical protein
MSFKDLASKNGYGAASVLEKIMEDGVKFGLVFPSAKNAAAEAEARRANRGLSLVNNQNSSSIWQKGQNAES